MKNNPIPFKSKGKVICEDDAKPKPHERITANALADAGYIVRCRSSVFECSNRYI